MVTCNERHKKKPRTLSGLREFYEQAAEIRGDMDVYWAKGFYQSLLIEKIFSILKDVHEKLIIDVGCGDGRTSIFLGEGDNSVVGIDISYKRVFRAGRKTTPKYLDKNFYVQAYAECIPFKTRIFDWVICTEVLEHVLDYKETLREISRILKPQGKALISIPTVSLKRYFDIRHAKRPIYFDPEEHLREFTHYNIPQARNEFILIKDFMKELALFRLNVLAQYNIGFELPLWISRFGVGRYIDGRLLKIKRINEIISLCPVLRKFTIYTILLLEKGNTHA